MFENIGRVGTRFIIALKGMQRGSRFWLKSGRVEAVAIVFTKEPFSGHGGEDEIRERETSVRLAGLGKVECSGTSGDLD